MQSLTSLALALLLAFCTLLLLLFRGFDMLQGVCCLLLNGLVYESSVCQPTAQQLQLLEAAGRAGCNGLHQPSSALHISN